jgi:hypothetical protein
MIIARRRARRTGGNLAPTWSGRHTWGMTIAGVTRELLVRYLDVWTPAALHSAKRVTFAYAWSAPNGVDDRTQLNDQTEPHAATTEAALRGFAEFDDLLRARKLTYVVVGPDAEIGAHLQRVQAELGTSANLAVHAVVGRPEHLLAPALTAAGSGGAPLLVYAHVAAPLDGLHGAGRPVEQIGVAPTGDWIRQRDTFHANGFALTTGVEFLAANGDACLVSLATDRANSLDAFKNALWSVDEYAGVRYRDPTDPDGHLQDISLEPHPGPLRRAILSQLAAAGPQTVTQLRHFVLTETIYRASDATRVISALRHTGAVTSDAAHGRLSCDVVVARAGT